MLYLVEGLETEMKGHGIEFGRVTGPEEESRRLGEQCQDTPADPGGLRLPDCPHAGDRSNVKTNPSL